jgi:hypothetical protein
MLREAEVFGLHHKFSVRAGELDITNPNRERYLGAAGVNQSTASVGYTVPQPFDLSH